MLLTPLIVVGNVMLIVGDRDIAVLVVGDGAIVVLVVVDW